MIGILSASKPHSHSRLNKPMLKILPIYNKTFLWKQRAQVTCSKYVSRLRHASKFQMFSAKLNMMVKVVKPFTSAL